MASSLGYGTLTIDPQLGATPLRLVQPNPSVRPVDPVQPVDKAVPSGSSDTLSFEAVYQANLPKITMSDALDRLDRIRTQLVAARTDVPIHFETTAPPPGLGSSSPLTRAYFSNGPAPADANASATDAEAARLDETA